MEQIQNKEVLEDNRKEIKDENSQKFYFMLKMV